LTTFEIIKEDNFSYLETNPKSDHVIVLLHGLLGALSNFEGILQNFHDKYNVVIPILPIFEMPLFDLSVQGLVKYVVEFVDFKGFKKIHLMGNSLGGHLALIYTIENPQKVQSLTLAGSSGLFESAMGSTYPKRGDYEYIKNKAQETFYDPKIATKELVDELFEIVNNRNKAIRILATSKSAVRHNLGDKLHDIKTPTLLVWGKQDKVTPPFVGDKFHYLLQNSKLYFVDQCGHAPMMERPDVFNEIFGTFLIKNPIV
jgi:2-hydroxy-6-oxonona-2,4-dienedioate hydrolase